jgi:hypothetical protein|uniref:Uncharacterized protein n=1 Tax=Myoviridae sp. ctXXl13 TaxID=2827691 RepID=A0A8S5TIY1_9CAUD|nr:MAG TPA: hypothetical protein [Myoviridae sp. ctXXl13]
MPESKDFFDINNIHPINIIFIIYLIYQFIYKNRSQIGTFLRRYYKGESAEKEIENSQQNETENSSTHTQNDNTDRYISHNSNRVDDIINKMDFLSKELERIGEVQNNIINTVTKIETDVSTVNHTMNSQLIGFTDRIDFLLKSDMEDKKAYITDNYNKYYYRYKKIDMYTLETMEKIYDIYLQEGGDSFVQLMMTNIRKLEVVRNLDEFDNVN